MTSLIGGDIFLVNAGNFTKCRCQLSAQQATWYDWLEMKKVANSGCLLLVIPEQFPGLFMEEIHLSASRAVHGLVCVRVGGWISGKRQLNVHPAPGTAKNRVCHRDAQHIALAGGLIFLKQNRICASVVASLLLPL